MAYAIKVSRESKSQIIGDGMLAKAFKNSAFNVFASGVSDSSCKDPAQFKREKDLLPEYPVLYFGTCSQEDSPYVAHKVMMQDEVLKRGGMVFRLPTVAGESRNPNTLLNFLYRSLIKREVITVFEEAKRRIVDVNDVVLMSARIGFRNRSFDIAPQESHYIIDIVHALEKVVGIEAEIRTVPGGKDYEINPVPDDYLDLDTILKKYYGW